MASRVKPGTRLVKRSEAMSRLGCGRTKFWEQWHPVFTDPRPPERRTKRYERHVYEDELDIAIEKSAKGSSAVLLYRRLMGRAK
ncbi:MAG TPA: hypothetical protein VGE74_21035 [Gemmata sp.]